MASLGVNSITKTSATLYVAELNTTTTYAEVYISCAGRTSPNLAKTSASSTSTGWNLTGLSAGTYYSVSWNIKSKGGSTANGYGGFTTVAQPPPPSPIYGLNVDASSNAPTLYVAWSGGDGASVYRVELYNSYGGLIASDGTYSRSYTFSGLSEYTSYRVKVYGKNDTGNGTPSEQTARTGDFTAPTISYVSGDGNGKMQLNWSAYDNGSGLRYNSTYKTQISSRNGNTFGNEAYTNNTYRSFTTDASGNEFVHNSYYYMRVSAYDNASNSSTKDTQVQYKMARPNSWYWHVDKVAGQNVNVTAAEWNSFCIRINQFRQYRNLSNYPFTTVRTGDIITASIVNEARNAISSMASSPALMYKGNDIYASYFNSLRNSLNSIT